MTSLSFMKVLMVCKITNAYAMAHGCDICAWGARLCAKGNIKHGEFVVVYGRGCCGSVHACGHVLPALASKHADAVGKVSRKPLWPLREMSLVAPPRSTLQVWSMMAYHFLDELFEHHWVC